MFVRKSRRSAFELIGRPPDSSQKGSNSQYKQFTTFGGITWVRRSILRLVIHRTDDKVDRISFEE